VAGETITVDGADATDEAVGRGVGDEIGQFAPAPLGRHHQRAIFYERAVVDQVGHELAARLRDLTIQLYSRGAEITARNGIILADTKFEFGWSVDGELTLGDEVLTSDSSRFWPADEWEPGRIQFALDKQVVRDWAAGTGWDKCPPAPPVPDDIVAAMRARYIEVYQRITGQTWPKDEMA